MDPDSGRLRNILLQISDRLSNDDRSKLCFQIGDDVPRRIRQEIEQNSRASMDIIWLELIDRGLISTTNVKYLIDRLRIIGRIDLAKRLENFAGGTDVASSVFTRHEPQN